MMSKEKKFDTGSICDEALHDIYFYYRCVNIRNFEYEANISHIQNIFD